MDINPRKFNLHKIKHIYCTVLLLYYNSKQNIPYNCPTGSQQVLSFICVIELEYITKGHIATHTIFVLNLNGFFL